MRCLNGSLEFRCSWCVNKHTSIHGAIFIQHFHTEFSILSCTHKRAFIIYDVHHARLQNGKSIFDVFINNMSWDWGAKTTCFNKKIVVKGFHLLMENVYVLEGHDDMVIRNDPITRCYFQFPWDEVFPKFSLQSPRKLYGSSTRKFSDVWVSFKKRGFFFC